MLSKECTDKAGIGPIMRPLHTGCNAYLQLLDDIGTRSRDRSRISQHWKTTAYTSTEDGVLTVLRTVEFFYSGESSYCTGYCIWRSFAMQPVDPLIVNLFFSLSFIFLTLFFFCPRGLYHTSAILYFLCDTNINTVAQYLTLKYDIWISRLHSLRPGLLSVQSKREKHKCGISRPRQPLKKVK